MNRDPYYLKGDVLIVTVLDKKMPLFVVSDGAEDKAVFGEGIRPSSLASTP